MSLPDRPSSPHAHGREVALEAVGENAKAQSREAFVLQTVSGETETILELVGELDMASARLLRKEIEAALESEAHRIIVDLSELEFIDSKGIKVLYDAWHHSHRVPGRLTIRGAQGLVAKVLGMVGLDSVILDDS